MACPIHWQQPASSPGTRSWARRPLPLRSRGESQSDCCWRVAESAARSQSPTAWGMQTLGLVQTPVRCNLLSCHLSRLQQAVASCPWLCLGCQRKAPMEVVQKTYQQNAHVHGQEARAIVKPFSSFCRVTSGVVALWKVGAGQCSRTPCHQRQYLSGLSAVSRAA